MPPTSMEPLVALLAEGVDRNLKVNDGWVKQFKSPSSRRAWIEIAVAIPLAVRTAVALLAEGVDRNSIRCLLLSVVSGRPPRGGRG